MALVAAEEAPFGVAGWAKRFGRVSGVRFVTRSEAGPAFGIPWPERVRWLTQEAKAMGAGILIIDTLRFWATLGPKDENDAGAVQAAMAPVISAAGQFNLAIVITHHARKAEGIGGTSAAGSLAFVGAVDTVLEVKTYSGVDDDDPRRKILARGRFVDPENKFGAEQVIRYESPTPHEPARYTLEGSAKEAREAELARKVIEFVRRNPGCSAEDIDEGAGIRKDDARRTRNRLKGLDLMCSGTGTPGDPHKWRVVERGEYAA